MVLFDLRASEVIFFVLHEGMWVRPDVCLRSICHRTRLFIKHGLITTPLLFCFFSPLSCVPRTDWKLLQTCPRSWDLMRREDSSVIALNPDAGDAFQVIRPWALAADVDGGSCLSWAAVRVSSLLDCLHWRSGILGEVLYCLSSGAGDSLSLSAQLMRQSERVMGWCFKLGRI